MRIVMRVIFTDEDSDERVIYTDEDSDESGIYR